MSKEELETAVLSLPVEERADLAHKIIESIDGHAGDLDEAWLKEVDHRVADVVSGKVKTIPGEEVFRKAFERRAQK